jgi:magnesium-protoporphyrin IX monomethyl ester (oxidative) cyclase
MKANPGHRFAPLFAFFEPWCQDKNRHGDIFNLLIRRWPSLRSGLRARLLSRFLLWSVFFTHSLSVSERGDFYQLLGLEPARFDEEVIRQTNRTAERAFPAVCVLEGGRFFDLGDRVIATLAALRSARAAGGAPLGVFQRWGLCFRLAGLLLRQFLQPMLAPSARIA